MKLEELRKESPKDLTLLEVLPDDFDASYISWAPVQHSDESDHLEGDLYLVKEKSLLIYKLSWSSGSETVHQRVLTADRIRQVTRTWSSRRGFDNTDTFGSTDEFELTVELDDQDRLHFPIRPNDYRDQRRAWEQADQLGHALIRGMS